MMQHTLNPQVLSQLHAFRMEDGSDLACTLVQIYLEATPPLIDALEDAINTGDTPTTAQLIARLRGSSSIIGALRFCILCSEFELSPPTGYDAVARRIARLREEYNRLSKELKHNVAPRDTLKYGT